MKYAEVNATGDAGEYLFAYKIASLLKWPCRLLNIDIGIDAQIEVLDNKQLSMGQFIAVQIKSTSDASKKSICVESKHLDYWNSLEIPVLISLVNISTEKVFIKEIDKLNESRTIHFSKTDELSDNMKDNLRLLAYYKSTQKIKEKLSHISKHINKLLFDLTDEQVSIIADYNYYLDFMSKFKEIEIKLHELKIELQPITKIIGDCNYVSILKNYMHARNEYITFIENNEFNIYNSEEYDGFINEYVGNNSYLELKKI